MNTNSTSMYHLTTLTPYSNCISRITQVIQLLAEFKDDEITYSPECEYRLLETPDQQVVCMCTVNSCKVDICIAPHYKIISPIIYNLVRLPGTKWKGIGQIMLSKLVAEKGKIYISTDAPRLGKYYQEIGFQKTVCKEQKKYPIYVLQDRS